MSDIQDQQTSSTFKVYAQDVWPISDIDAAVQAYKNNDQDANTGVINHLSCDVEVLEKGQKIAYPKQKIDGYTASTSGNPSQGYNDLHRASSSLGGFAYVAKDGSLKKYGSDIEPETSEDGKVFSEAEEISRWAEVDLQAFADSDRLGYLPKVLMSLPDIRSQGMYTFEGYLMGAGIEKSSLFNLTGLVSVNNIGVSFDDYILLKAGGEGQLPSICSLGIAYDKKGEVMGFFHRNISITENLKDQYELSVNHRYVLPGGLHQVLSDFTSLDELNSETSNKEPQQSLLADIQLVIDNNLYDSMAMGERNSELVDARKLRLEKAQKIVQGPSENSVDEEPLYPYSLNAHIEKCADFDQKIGSVDELQESISDVNQILSEHPSINAVYSNAFEYGDFGNESHDVADYGVKLQQAVQKIAHLFFTNGEKGESFREFLADKKHFNELFFDKIVSCYDSRNLFFIGKDIGIQKQSIGDDATMQSLFEIGTKKGFLWDMKNLTQVFVEKAKVLGYDGKGSHNKYLKPVTQDLRKYAEGLALQTDFKQLVKQVFEYDTVLPLRRWAHNAKVWLGRAFKGLRNFFLSSEKTTAKVNSSSGGTYTQMQRIGLEVADSKNITWQQLQSQIESLVSFLIPTDVHVVQTAAYDAALVGRMLKSIKELNLDVTNNTEGSTKASVSKQDLAQRLIGACLYHFLVGSGKNDQDRSVRVMGLLNELKDFDSQEDNINTDLTTAKKVLFSSRRYFRGLFNHRLDQTHEADEGVSSDQTIDYSKYNAAKAELFTIVLNNELKHEQSDSNKAATVKDLQDVYQNVTGLDSTSQPTDASSTRKMDEIPGIKALLKQCNRKYSQDKGPDEKDSGLGSSSEDELISGSSVAPM